MSINNYNLIKTNYHILEIDSKEFLFHIPTSSVFELSTESANLLRKMENKEEKIYPLSDIYEATVAVQKTFVPTVKRKENHHG